MREIAGAEKSGDRSNENKEGNSEVSSVKPM
jgi:hypothetical protein